MPSPVTPLPDPRAFVAAETRLRPVPLVPEISLHVADEAVPLWHRTEEELGEMGLPPPFWAFAWAGGQALARHVLDHPHLVEGRSVLDFASGSGLVGIAAAKAGARIVTCADIDPFALAAIGLNGAANDAVLEGRQVDLIGTDEGWETVLAGDICYERDLAARVFDWLLTLSARGAIVLIGDPGRSYLPKDRLEQLQVYSVPVTRELEDMEIKRTAVWRPRA
ncbi:class I SAM-dependent methyltransferase [Aquabacter sp. P-9]|uniref:class I SAM-dependent methyltransferase n=1 Tax=Aquabacter sediminis TaxID=3029197 RepID=UPI00237D584D|nr:methyltransferase [Aquabacter sp. P-9]MDE1569258.1 methyltransferase [Aquabacter sp. P-9]